VEFICPDPNAVVRAANVRATLDAFNLIPTLGRKIIARHNLNVDDLRPDNYVLVQSWLNALRDIQREVGISVVREVGAHIIENADFPAHFTTAMSILEALDKIYYVNHRGDVGHYYSSRNADSSLTIRCETPYPRHFEWGLIEGITRNKRVHDRNYTIDFADGPPGSIVTCTLTIRPL
jgi:hypothetical protein